MKYHLVKLFSKFMVRLASKSLMFHTVLTHSHKKQKDSLECSLDQVLFAAELEFPKILIPRLPQNISNVNIG